MSATAISHAEIADLVKEDDFISQTETDPSFGKFFLSKMFKCYESPLVGPKTEN